MAKFMPVVGEAYTTIESAWMLLRAGWAKVRGDDTTYQELAENAIEAWKEYSETNLFAAPVNMLVQKVKGDTDKYNQIHHSFVNSVQDCMDGTPGVGHVKGVFHYVTGNKERGHRCMEMATRSTVVVVAGLATGGLGAGLAVGAATGIGTGVAYDGLATVVDRAVNGNDAHLHGSLALRHAGTMSHKEFICSVLGVAGDGLAGVGGNQLGRNVRSWWSGQMALEGAYHSSEQLKRKGIYPRTATRVTMDAAEASKKAQTALSKPTAFATSVAEDSATGQQGVGQSGACRRQMRIQTFKRLGFDSKTKAGKATGYDQPSHLQAKHENVQKVLKRPQAACAEHPAFSDLAEKIPNYDPQNVNTATVYNTGDFVHTIKRCGNCLNFGERMGTVLTDYIPEGTNVPTSGYLRDGYIKRAFGAIFWRHSKNNNNNGCYIRAFPQMSNRAQIAAICTNIHAHTFHPLSHTQETRLYCSNMDKEFWELCPLITFQNERMYLLPATREMDTYKMLWLLRVWHMPQYLGGIPTITKELWKLCLLITCQKERLYLLPATREMDIRKKCFGCCGCWICRNIW